MVDLLQRLLHLGELVADLADLLDAAGDHEDQSEVLAHLRRHLGVDLYQGVFVGLQLLVVSLEELLLQ